nr:putative 2-oxoglutarate (2OG) and Fe(II)-dependent oxygenase superfamily protein [Tanacetum cinerariifolium]
VPGYVSLRQNLLNLAPRYNFGWSHGKEKLESGKPDLLKGSFYANPILDKPTTEASLIERYPAYCGSNIWPQSNLPELEVG